MNLMHKGMHKVDNNVVIMATEYSLFIADISVACNKTFTGRYIIWCMHKRTMEYRPI